MDDRSSNIKGKIRREGQFLVVTFPFDKARFAAIKKIKKSRFDKQAKRWEVPLLSFGQLRTNELFSPEVIKYDFDEKEAEEAFAALTAEQSNAWKRFAENPFMVSAADAAIIDPEAFFYADGRTKTLRLRLKYSAKSKKILSGYPEAQYLKPEKAFALPVLTLNSLLRSFRDKEVTFAVHEEVGRILYLSAEKRAAIAAGKIAPSAEDLEKCLLAPYIDFARDRSCCILKNFNTTDLSLLFPKTIPFAEKKKRAARLSEQELLHLLARAWWSDYRVWQTADVQSFLDSRKPAYKALLQEQPGSCPDVLLPIVQPGVFCALNHAGNPCLVVDARSMEALRDQVAGWCKDGKIAADKRGGVFKIRDSCLEELCAELDGLAVHLPSGVFFQGKEFGGFRGEICRRGAVLQRQRSFKEAKDMEVPDMEPALSRLLFPHQRVAAAWLLQNQRAFLGDDMGLGKTLSVLSTFSVLKKQDERHFLLVVCPNSLTRNWQREASQWLANLKLALLPDQKAKRELFLRKLMITDPWWIAGLVVNYETIRVPDVCEKMKELCTKVKTVLCLDEAQRTKNPRSKTFAALRQIACLCERRILLSGTPTPKDIADIWSQMYLLDDGERLGRSYYGWLEQVAELGTKWSDFAIKRYREEQVEESVLRVHEVLLRRKKEEVVDLPEKIFAIRDVVLTGEQAERYEEIRKQLLLRVSGMDGITFLREITNVLEEFLRAVQVASNPRLIDAQWKGEPAKFLELDEIVREIVEEREEKLVIWTNYLLNVEELLHRYRHLKTAGFSGEVKPSEREKIVRDFQTKSKSSAKILVGIPAAGGLGITLTAAQTAVYIDKTWNGEHWLQSVDRLHRIGQKGTVNIISLQASLVDAIIYKNLRKKEKAQAKLLGDGGVCDQQDYPSWEELRAAVQARDED